MLLLCVHGDSVSCKHLPDALMAQQHMDGSVVELSTNLDITLHCS
jgi:hypothetical protein